MVKRPADNANDSVAAALKAAEPVEADLRRLGVDLDSLEDLVSAPVEEYREGIPALIDWLPRVRNIPLKKAIVRALTVKAAKPHAARVLVEEFKAASSSDALGLKWAIGNALSVVADSSVLEDILSLVRDRHHGRSREMLAVALGNIGGPEAIETLVELLSDEEVAGHAVVGLKKLAPPSARAALEPFTDHPKTWIRKEARKAIAKIDTKLSAS